VPSASGSTKLKMFRARNISLHCMWPAAFLFGLHWSPTVVVSAAPPITSRPESGDPREAIIALAERLERAIPTLCTGTLQLRYSGDVNPKLRTEEVQRFSFYCDPPKQSFRVATFNKSTPGQGGKQIAKTEISVSEEGALTASYTGTGSRPRWVTFSPDRDMATAWLQSQLGWGAILIGKAIGAGDMSLRDLASSKETTSRFVEQTSDCPRSYITKPLCLRSKYGKIDIALDSTSGMPEQISISKQMDDLTGSGRRLDALPEVQPALAIPRYPQERVTALKVEIGNIQWSGGNSGQALRCFEVVETKKFESGKQTIMRALFEFEEWTHEYRGAAAPTMAELPDGTRVISMAAPGISYVLRDGRMEVAVSREVLRAIDSSVEVARTLLTP